MNWEAISAVGEIVGAIAVVVTLIYLAVQVRQGTKATPAVSVQTASSLAQEFLLAVGKDPATAQIWANYLADPDTICGRPPACACPAGPSLVAHSTA